MWGPYNLYINSFHSFSYILYIYLNSECVNTAGEGCTGDRRRFRDRKSRVPLLRSRGSHRGLHIREGTRRQRRKRNTRNTQKSKNIRSERANSNSSRFGLRTELQESHRRSHKRVRKARHSRQQRGRTARVSIRRHRRTETRQGLQD